MQTDIPALDSVPSAAMCEAVDTLLTEARADKMLDPRSANRHPFFRPVTVVVEDGGVRLFWAFTRDVSYDGIGLLHNMPLKPQEVTVIIYCLSGERTRLRCLIEWCRPCGEGWYLSGGKLIGLVGPD